MRMLAAIMTIYRKDILTEFRTRQVITSVLVFSVLVIVIFNFALGPGNSTDDEAAAGILWVALTFGGVLGFNHIFAVEKEAALIEGLMLCPVSRATIFWGKLLGSFSFNTAVAAVITPIFLGLFNLPLWLPQLALIIPLGIAGFAAVGTLFSAIAVNTRARDIIFPILFLPVVVPVIIPAVRASALALAGFAWTEILVWLQIMLAFDIIYLVVATLVFDFVIEE